MTPTCPIAAALDALALLQNGRTAIAQRAVESVPALIEAALVRNEGIAYLRGQTDARRIITAARECEQSQPPRAPAPRKPNRLEWLRDVLADPTQRDRARAALRMDDHLLGQIAAGTATLSGTHWRKLREAPA